MLAAGRHWSTSYAYNANNQLVRQSQELDTSAPDANGQMVNQAGTEVFYDKLGQQVAVKDALGNVNAMVFDAGGKLMAERHADGGRTDYGYNAFGEQTQSRLDARAQTTGVPAHDIVTNNKYDKLGHLLESNLASGVQAYSYSNVAASAASDSSVSRATEFSPVW